MTLPTSDISMSAIWSEANSPYSSGQLSLLTMSFFSYFAGPNGSNSQTDNNWGMHEGSGANRIYGLAAKTSSYAMGDYSGLTYYYDNSTFQVTLEVTNSLAPLPFPPNPPGSNDANVNIELWDSGFSYQYLLGGGMAAENGGTYGPSSVSQLTDPIIFRGYWKVNVGGVGPMFGGGSCDILINGNTKVTGGAVAAGPGGSTFDSVTYGTEDVASYGGYTGLFFKVRIF
jgi:hypothetical protein